MEPQRTTRTTAPDGDLIVMTPIVQGHDENVIRVQRYQGDEKVDGQIRHVAGGHHVGIVVRHYSPEHETHDPSVNPHLHLDFDVFLVAASTGQHKQERRVLRFWFYDETTPDVRTQLANSFFRDLLKGGFPKDYVSFIKAVLKVMQQKYHEIRRIDVDMLLIKEHVEHAPTSIEHECDAEIENVTVAHVQELLEHAFPNGLSVQFIAQTLRCTVEVVIEMLEELRIRGVIGQKTETGEWLRIDQSAEAHSQVVDLTESFTELETLVMPAVETKSKPAVNENRRKIRAAKSKAKQSGKQSKNTEEQTSSGGESAANSSCASPVGGQLIPGLTGALKPSSDASQRPTVAIISALFVEKMAVDAMIHNKKVLHRYKSDGESNVYTLGEIGGHRVVATKLSAIGNSREAMTAAGSITTRLLGNFSNVEHVFVVGCAGGVENFTDGERHLRRGDVIVSSGKHSYVFCEKLELDRQTEKVCGFTSRDWNPKDNIIQRIVNDIQQSHGKQEEAPWSESLSDEVIDKLNQNVMSSRDYSFARPPTESDTMAVPDGTGNLLMMPHPARQNETVPRLHAGTIAGASMISSDSELRDKYSSLYNVRAFTADFDSVVDSIRGNCIDSWALVRGVADYADGTRNKQWQAYAALQAAALTKMLISRLPTSEQ